MLSHHRCTGTTCGELYGWMRVHTETHRLISTTAKNLIVWTGLD